MYSEEEAKKGHKCYLDQPGENTICHRTSCYGCGFWQQEMWTYEDRDDFRGDD